jgi:hypothetical protein
MPSQVDELVKAANQTSQKNLYVVADMEDCRMLQEKLPLKQIVVERDACLMVQQASTLSVNEHSGAR